jgi:hypothetical protein
MLENFVFLVVILLLEFLVMFLRIEIVTIIVAFFGFLFGASVPSEIAYPAFNIFVMLLSSMNLYDLVKSRPKKK